MKLATDLLDKCTGDAQTCNELAEVRFCKRGQNALKPQDKNLAFELFYTKGEVFIGSCLLIL